MMIRYDKVSIGFTNINSSFGSALSSAKFKLREVKYALVVTKNGLDTNLGNGEPWKANLNQLQMCLNCTVG